MDECKVKFEDCEYDAETDTMTTTGKASCNGKEYDVSFIEHDGRAPVINLSSDNVEMGYANGSTIDGYGLNTEEGKALYNAADTIYRTMFEKADEFQREDPMLFVLESATRARVSKNPILKSSASAATKVILANSLDLSASTMTRCASLRTVTETS